KFDVEAEARARGIDAYKVRAANAVGDRLVKDIVADAYRGISQTASMIPPSREPAKPKGTGWVEAPLIKAPDTRWIDAQTAAQDQRDRTAAIRARVESAWIESHFDKGPRIESEYEPFDSAHMKK